MSSLASPLSRPASSLRLTPEVTVDLGGCRKRALNPPQRFLLCRGRMGDDSVVEVDEMGCKNNITGQADTAAAETRETREAEGEHRAEERNRRGARYTKRNGSRSHPTQKTCIPYCMQRKTFRSSHPQPRTPSPSIANVLAQSSPPFGEEHLTILSRLAGSDNRPFCFEARFASCL